MNKDYICDGCGLEWDSEGACPRCQSGLFRKKTEFFRKQTECKVVSMRQRRKEQEERRLEQRVIERWTGRTEGSESESEEDTDLSS
jgi:hypothetical protein